MVQEPSSEMFLQTISRINFQKWHSKVRIVISKDFEFEVVALIDSGADLNCIQEGIIPSKYFRTTKERLTSASGGKMQIEFKIPKAYVCQDNTCFKTTFVLVKNMTDRVILGNPSCVCCTLSSRIVKESLPVLLANHLSLSFLGAQNLERLAVSKKFLCLRLLTSSMPKYLHPHFQVKPRTLITLYLPQMMIL